MVRAKYTSVSSTRKPHTPRRDGSGPVPSTRVAQVTPRPALSTLTKIEMPPSPATWAQRQQMAQTAACAWKK
eukprot:scaffold330054_cov63-Tisochrysis_lutea.AAC.1